METIGLFDYPVGMPLAARLRPEKLTDLVGQEGIVESSGAIKAYSQNLDSLPSLILYGPPGTGKTTLARILASAAERRVIEVSAVNASVSDLRNAYEQSNQDMRSGGKPGVLFIDEIHRFSKVQQESVLKHVEEGSIVLIGATTENPSFALTSAIMSRTLLLTLKSLSETDLLEILNRALIDERGLNAVFTAQDGALRTITRLSSGDARKALTLLETAATNARVHGRTEITDSDITANIATAMARYDATGDQHYDIISAYIKSVRGSDVDAALHYLARMIVGGEDPRFIARRLVILAAEDIGLADPSAITLANSVMSVVAQIGMPEGRIPLAEATIYLALAPKSNSAYKAINEAIQAVEAGFAPELPIYLRSSPPERGPEAYVYPHDTETNLSNQPLLSQPSPSSYEPKNVGFEAQLVERVKRINETRRKLGL